MIPSFLESHYPQILTLTLGNAVIQVFPPSEKQIICAFQIPFRENLFSPGQYLPHLSFRSLVWAFREIYLSLLIHSSLLTLRSHLWPCPYYPQDPCPLQGPCLYNLQISCLRQSYSSCRHSFPAQGHPYSPCLPHGLYLSTLRVSCPQQNHFSCRHPFVHVS